MTSKAVRAVVAAARERAVNTLEVDHLQQHAGLASRQKEQREERLGLLYRRADDVRS
jgi:hypothetical protein